MYVLVHVHMYDEYIGLLVVDGTGVQSGFNIVCIEYCMYVCIYSR